LLNDSSAAEETLGKVKEQLNMLFHSKINIYLKYKEIFREEPSRKLKGFFDEIGVPYTKLEEILSLIKYITSGMKKVLDQLDPWQTHTYLNTSTEFEKIFDIEDPKYI